MFDIRLIVNEKEKVLKSLASKNFKDVSIINRAEELYNLRKKIVFESENIRAIQKQKSKEMPVIMKNGTSEEKAQIKEELKNLSEKVKSFAPKLKEVDNELEIILLSIPNKLADDVPIGKDETENIEIKKWGEKPNFSFKAKEHFDLMNKGLDLERASKLSGARFVIYSGELAQLERAVMNFMLDTHKKAGYIEVVPPILVNRETMTSSGQLPKFEEDAYKTTDDMFLIPTAEVSLVNLHRNEIIPQKNLPLKYTAYTPCFRREAGSYGKDTRGIIRLHQFNKVELVQFVKAEESWKALDEILSEAEKILQLLNIHYRVVELCSGDTGFSASKTFDIEVWLPGQNKYREISSCSNTCDFQARRASIKTKKEGEKPEFVHTLNGSGLAIDRTIVAIIENYQQEDGSVKIPEILKPYMNDKEYLFK